MDAGVGNWTLDGDDNAKLPELLKAAAVFAAGIRPRIMYLDAIYSLVIGFVGAILFVLLKFGGDLAQTATIRTCAVLASASAGRSRHPSALAPHSARLADRGYEFCSRDVGGLNGVFKMTLSIDGHPADV